MKRKYYIAYGSNMDEESMLLRCPDAKLIGSSKVKDHELLFKGLFKGVYATIEEKKDSQIPVLIWEISEEDEVELDIYENFPLLYYKKSLEVEVNGESIEGMVYLMEKGSTAGEPKKQYYEIIEKAYEKLGFDKTPLKRALQINK
ncbi:MAG: gamma-glutamylcyclotransferase family protein [Acetivibrio sp.]